MRTSEMGVYILGAVALGLLGLAGAVTPGATDVIFWAALAAAAGYVSQSFRFHADVYEEADLESPQYVRTCNAVFGVISCGLWLIGVFVLGGY